MNNNLQSNLFNGITGGSVLPAADISLSAAPVLPTGAAPIAGQYQDLSDTKKLILVKPGYFWCYTHLQDLPLEKQSIDKRYCQQCYEILVKEADDMKATGNRRKAWWVPCNHATGIKHDAEVQGQPTHSHDVSVTTGNCLFCGAELTKRRKSKLFCNATCRVRYSRQQKAVTA